MVALSAAVSPSEVAAHVIPVLDDVVRFVRLVDEILGIDPHRNTVMQRYGFPNEIGRGGAAIDRCRGQSWHEFYLAAAEVEPQSDYERTRCRVSQVDDRQLVVVAHVDGGESQVRERRHGRWWDGRDVAGKGCGRGGECQQQAQGQQFPCRSDRCAVHGVLLISLTLLLNAGRAPRRMDGWGRSTAACFTVRTRRR